MSAQTTAIKDREIAHARRDFIVRLSKMKHEAMALGLYRTGRMLDIPVQEIGWELQGADTPEWQKKRQLETLTP